MRLKKSSFGAGAVLAVVALLSSTATANATVESKSQRFANWTYQQCVQGDASNANLYPRTCSTSVRLQYWTWSGVFNGNTKLVNLASGHCLDSNDAGDVYVLKCDAGSHYQVWQVHLPSGGTPWIVNTQTHRNLEQEANGTYKTMPPNQSELRQRFTIG
ncbi:RICIN domain-containing protein [Amycolatopsis sp. NBC_00345]|uniref:RICIN domain-containing protein n=1 Tax=Amycolatopsis sp. NBC_00345 TaxID=2975955 RepID=UPI002E26F395